MVQLVTTGLSKPSKVKLLRGVCEIVLRLARGKIAVFDVEFF
jgi:hypothetical protein